MAFPQAQRALDLNPGGLIINAEAYTLNRHHVEEHFDALDPVVARRLIRGRAVPAHEYLRLQREWSRLRRETLAALQGVDGLLCPTVMTPPLPVAEVDKDHRTFAAHNLRCLRNTTVGNILNLCALSVPCGFTAQGLPIGLMIYAPPFCEAKAVRIAHAYQQATDFHLREPAPGRAS